MQGLDHLGPEPQTICTDFEFQYQDGYSVGISIQGTVPAGAHVPTIVHALVDLALSKELEHSGDHGKIISAS